VILLVVLPEPLVVLTPVVGEITQVIFPPEPPDTVLVTVSPTAMEVAALQVRGEGGVHGIWLTVIYLLQFTLASGEQPAGVELLVLVNVTV
jgi:hypothetical protein